MSLETLLTELIAELKANTAAHKGAAPAAAAAGTTRAAPAAKKIDEAVVKSLAVKVSEKHGKPFAKKMIKDVGGAADLANVKPEKLAALHAAFEKAMSEDAPSEEAAEDDEL